MRVRNAADGSDYGLKINKNNEAEVNATAWEGIERVSEREEKAFALTSSYAATGGEEVLYVRNDSSSDDLHICCITIANSVASRWDVFRVTSGTAAGTDITPVNLNLSSGVAIDTTAKGNASVTGTLVGSSVAKCSSIAGSSFEKNFHGALILKKGEAIAVTAVTSGTVDVTVTYYYEPS